ncbi:MAG: class I SAM-dependent methyltransferase [Lachnospiraceae bacterium]|nr:class I SAM-dependent methyltransferase [Lachnospiraceae bacterium]
MVRKSETWYKEIWTLDIKEQSWTEDTKKQVDFLIETLGLTGGEKILDLACGFGRHSLEFARRGFAVVGVDITKAYVEDAKRQAKEENLSATFLQMDIRDVDFLEEFDVVLNMADGAIGYLENDAENLKIFDVVAKALRPGGKHVMDIMSADYADTHFPCNLWDAGANGITLSKFEWDRKSKIMLYGQKDFTYGEELTVSEFGAGDPIRLYHQKEIEEILQKRNMRVKQVFGKFDGTPGSENEIQMIVVSEKLN